ncbi:MAG: PD-(D/E)XK nuclease family protein [Cyclobacteriaceae bacterium]|nr:MAG: PD-(D/E)XK nuclease family protein [Cyclobacteriaceae bacterium]
MTPFLLETAQKIFASHSRLEEVTLVFPNRRAILFFRKHLGTLLKKPAFAPTMLTIEEYIKSYSTLQVPDKLELVHRLYKAYTETVKSNESFDRFYYWGEMLLRDFEEIDKYLVNAEMLFRDLSHQKELDASFDYLTDEQKKFLLDFWGNFDEYQTENRKKFLDVWKHLYDVYTTYRTLLVKEELAFEGMVHREVAEKILQGQILRTGHEIFIGFNALTKAEEVIIAHAVEGGASVYWDVDEYYLNNVVQEAGEFFREYQKHKVLGKTFEAQVPANFRREKNIKLYGAAQPVGQAKLMGQELRKNLEAGALPEETLVVLPDEKLLLPALHSVSDSVEKLNVTMGFSLSATPIFNFVELLIELQISRKDEYFHHRPVLSLLNHPFTVSADSKVAQSKRKEMLKHNWVSVPKNFLASESELHRVMFVVADVSSITHYLKTCLTLLGSLDSLYAFDKEYIFQMLKCLNRMEEVLGNQYSDLRSFLRFFRQYVRTVRIPFSGEPLQGLQLMGMLETRNLDFKNVYILSLNEGSLPSGGSKGSYIPYNIRRAYTLPTLQHQDAMYAYLFYRVIQRAENVSLFYNTETDILGQGEMSRYLQQLMFESGKKFQHHALHNALDVNEVKPIVIKKDKAVLEALEKLSEQNEYRKFSGLSPSALNTYIECRLRFYFRHVAKIKEADEIEEDMDARVLGNFVHNVMEAFYQKLVAQKGSTRIEAQDLEKQEKFIQSLLDQEVINTYNLNPNESVEYEGQLILVSEVVKRFIDKILEHDKKHAPFTVEGVEQNMEYTFSISAPAGRVLLGGKIDRVDRKEDVLRIVDYKTGRDKLDFDSIASLYAREGKRNKAAFQTLMYAWLYTKTKNTSGMRVIPGLLNSTNLFDDEAEFGLKMNRENLRDVQGVLPEFEARLRELLEELFNPDTVFDQTEEIDNCTYCPYKRICYR